MYKYTGGCHCGNIIFKMEIPKPLESYISRTCDCEFCKKHSASYISDPSGKLIFTINEQSKLNKYHQGSGIVDFLVCNNCGVLIGGCYEENGILFSAVNIKAVASTSIGNETIVSPKNLDDKDKIQRWKKLWFSKVELV